LSPEMDSKLSFPLQEARKSICIHPIQLIPCSPHTGIQWVDSGRAIAVLDSSQFTRDMERRRAEFLLSTMLQRIPTPVLARFYGKEGLRFYIRVRITVAPARSFSRPTEPVS
jgi:hypothetical protein